MSKKCIKCGYPLDDADKYCGRCGERQLFVCSNCGNLLKESDIYCRECGTRVPKEETENFETIKLGNQEWMAKNMAVTVDRYGEKLVWGRDYFYPNNDESLVDEYGLLYCWDAARRIAPEGWHLPSESEWDELEEFICSQNEFRCDDNPCHIAKTIASTTGWIEDDGDFTVGNDQTKNNATGFNAVPAGGYGGSYYDFGSYAYFWSATHNNRSIAYYRSLRYNYASVSSGSINKDYGYSVRCRRD